VTPIQQDKQDSFYILFVRTNLNRTALQQMLKISTTFSKTSIHRHFVTSRFIVVLFGASLSGYALPNASQTAENDFDENEHTLF
jgi:hypothetical protein